MNPGTARCRSVTKVRGVKILGLTVLALKPRFACSGSVKNQSVSKKQYLASGLPFPKVYERQPGSFSHQQDSL
jgi:hypothetical protein